IAELEHDLVGKPTAGEVLTAACIDSIIPTDRTFTTADLMAGLEAKYLGRSWRRRSIDERLAVLRETGVVRRVRRARQRQPAVYAMAGVEVESSPFGDLRLADAIPI